MEGWDSFKRKYLLLEAKFECFVHLYEFLVPYTSYLRDKGIMIQMTKILIMITTLEVVT